jgi:predicted HicB family RNase H-like nuclease
MSISKDKVRANLIINKDLKKQLEGLAAKENRSFNNLVITILENYLKPTEK